MTTQQPEALIFANDRPESIGYDLYQWCVMLAATIASVGVSMAIAFIGLHYQLARIADALEKANQLATQTAKQGEQP